ncbi:MAG TPA: DUF6677 family protein [Candidatus Dormibacteraeota bacterium]|nr:DUF6677 family protein [Candidatus Dormibacteraeota bacterium]
MASQKQIAATRIAGDAGEVKAVLIAIAAWLIPGMGHALQRRWGRALIYFSSVGTLVAVGVAMHGNIFTWEGANDAFDLLGFLSNLGTGIFCLLAQRVGGGMVDVSHAAGDYGTRFLAVAGVLNLLCVLEAYEIARGRKS